MESEGVEEIQEIIVIHLHHDHFGGAQLSPIASHFFAPLLLLFLMLTRSLSNVAQAWRRSRSASGQVKLINFV